MKAWLGLVVLGMVAGGRAQSSRWEALNQVKPGTTLIVETSNRYGPLGYDRCRMVGVDAASLTCMELGKQGARLVFPAEQVEFVSKVTKPFHLWPYLVLAVCGVFAGGMASGNPQAIGLGIVGGIIAIVAAGVDSQQRAFDAMTGRPRVPDERIELIYRRLPVPRPDASIPPPPASVLPELPRHPKALGADAEQVRVRGWAW